MKCEEGMGVADGPGEWNERSRFDQLQVRWLAANMEIDELMKLGELDDDTVQSIKAMIKTVQGSRSESLAPPSENRSAEFVIALAKELDLEAKGDLPGSDPRSWGTWTRDEGKKWLEGLDEGDEFFFPPGFRSKEEWLDEMREERGETIGGPGVLPPGERNTDEEGERRKRAKFSRPVPDNLQGVYAFPDELSGGLGKEPIPIPPEFITEFYFKVGPKTVLSKTLTESAARTLTVKSVEEDPFEKGMWNIEVTDNDGGPVPKIRIQEVKLGINLFNMDGLYKMTVQELTAKKAPDWLIRRAEELRLIQKTRLTEEGNTELMVGAGASALLLLLLFI